MQNHTETWKHKNIPTQKHKNRQTQKHEKWERSLIVGTSDHHRLRVKENSNRTYTRLFRTFLFVWPAFAGFSLCAQLF